MIKRGVCSVLALVLALALILPSRALDYKFNMSYIYFGDSSNYTKLVDRTQNSLNEVAPAYFSLNTQGKLVLTPAVSTDFVSKMHEKGILVVPYLTNDWVRDTGIAALKNMDALTTDLANAVSTYKLDGVNIDIENVTETQRSDYVAFVRLLRAKLPTGKRIIVAVSANPYGQTTGWAGSYDYAGLAKYCDYLMLMAYDESYSGSKPGPVASMSFVERSIKYALGQVPKEKIVLGLPFYGRIWSSGGGSVNGNGVSNEMVESLILKYNGTVTFDKVSQSTCATITVKASDSKPVIYGRTLSAGTYVIWYANEQALKAELALVTKYDLKGTGSWSLGQETAQTWDYYKLWLNGCTFSDVQSIWARDAILMAHRNGWLEGVSSTIFAPYASLTRAQAAAILVRMVGLTPAKSSYTFADCSGHWAQGYIDTARKYGIVSGTGENNFKPDRPVTRAEMAVMLNNMLGYSSTSQAFTDVSKTEYSWAYDAISALETRGILNGYADGSFRPQNSITRAETAAIITRVDLSQLVVP
ncbi:MAG: S-layer homology domain-containing protein [Oscillibacter sp.]|nr:S-layer homology domain-containing protein [Oscillibacter sp.]